MEVICKPVGPVQANCYLVIENGRGLIIDPGAQPQEIESLISALHIHVEGIVLTHAHFDHIGAVDALMEKYGVNVYVNPAEYDFFVKPAKNASSAFAGIKHLSLKARPVELKEGENEIGSFKVRAFYAPGHSAGSTLLEIGDNLFTGDVLFQGSIGRTDLATGDPDQMRQSLQFIRSLTRNYNVYPGHGPSTTLEAEKAGNPYLLYSLV